MSLYADIYVNGRWRGKTHDKWRLVSGARVTQVAIESQRKGDRVILVANEEFFTVSQLLIGHDVPAQHVLAENGNPKRFLELEELYEPVVQIPGNSRLWLMCRAARIGDD